MHEYRKSYTFSIKKRHFPVFPGHADPQKADFRDGETVLIKYKNLSYFLKKILYFLIVPS